MIRSLQLHKISSHSRHKWHVDGGMLRLRALTFQPARCFYSSTSHRVTNTAGKHRPSFVTTRNSYNTRNKCIQKLKVEYGIKNNSIKTNGIFRRSRRQSRWLSTVAAEEGSSSAALVVTRPPLPVRTALVATTTAIATPACPVVFVVNAGLRYVVFDRETRSVILGASTLIGATYTLIHFATFDLLPIAYSYGQLFLPFALVNGGLAGTAYMGLDLALGTTRVASIPWTGALMGAFVGLVGPVSGLYDASFQWFYNIPEADGFFTNLLNNQFMLPLSIATGGVVGTMMHPLLYYPVVGVKNVHWAKFSAPILAAATLLTASLYVGDYYSSSKFPPETYLTTDETRNLMLLSRLHAKRLQVEDWSQDVGYQPLGTGNRARESVVVKLKATKQGNTRTNMVFDSRRKAWLHYVTNGIFGEDFAIKTIPSQTEINQMSLRYLASDGAVAFIMLQGGHVHKNQNDEASSESMTRETLMQLTTDLVQTTNRRFKRSSNNNKARTTVNRIELASHGIALLLTRRQQKAPPPEAAREKEHRKLENMIRKVVPGIILYRDEEVEETKGCSVESQLDAFGWTGIQDDEVRLNTSRLWKKGLNQFLLAEQTQANRRQLTWAVTGLGIILLLYGGN